MTPPEQPIPAGPKSAWLRYAPLVLLLVAAAALFASGLHRQISIEAALAHREALAETVKANPLLAFGIYAAVYSAAIVFAIPGAVVFTMFGGFLFGWLGGAIGGILGSTLGGAIVVLIGSASIGASLQHAALPRFQRFAHGFRERAFSYIVLLRLIPVVPYVAINIASAVFRVPLSTFMSATALGIAPIAFCFAFIGSGLDRGLTQQADALRACQAANLPDCRFEFDPALFMSRELIAGLVLFSVLILLPILFRRRIARFGKGNHRKDVTMP